MSEQHEIEVTVESFRAAVERKNQLYKLLQDENFKGLVLEGYIKEESVRLTKTLGDASIRANDRAFNSTVDELKAIGLFDNHLRTIEQMGNHAEQQLAEYENMQLEDDME